MIRFRGNTQWMVQEHVGNEAAVVVLAGLRVGIGR
jgi:hypothetical protein